AWARSSMFPTTPQTMYESTRLMELPASCNRSRPSAHQGPFPLRCWNDRTVLFDGECSGNIAGAKDERRRNAQRLLLPEELFDDIERSFIAGQSSRRRDHIPIHHEPLACLDPAGRILFL